MIRLDDHRRFGAAVTLVIVAAALLIAGLLLIAGRQRAVPGLGAGAGIAAIDGWLLSRSLTRFSERSDQLGDRVGSRALTMLMMTRFLSVSTMVGVVICAKGMDPLGVIVGVLLFPVAIVGVALGALRAGTHSGGEATHAAG